MIILSVGLGTLSRVIISSSSRIRPPHYESAALRKRMGRYIGRDGEEERLAAYLWSLELTMTRNMIYAWESLAEEIREDRAVAAKRVSQAVEEGNPLWFPVSREWRTAALTLRAMLGDELDHCVRAKRRCEAVQTEFLQALDQGLTDRYDRANASTASTMTPLLASNADLLETTARVKAITDGDHRRIEELYALNDNRLAFAEDSRSVALDSIDRAPSSHFEPLVASWFRREQYAIEREGGGPRDRSADIIATSPCGKRVVVQCKHSGTGGGTVGTETVERLGGTAWKIHKADIAAIVTNRKYSAPATTLAAELGVRLVGRDELKQCATWGDPLLTVLENQLLVASSARRAQTAGVQARSTGCSKPSPPMLRSASSTSTPSPNRGLSGKDPAKCAASVLTAR